MEFCQKTQKNCAADARNEAGDFWDHTAVAADRKLVVSLVVGTRTKDQTHALVGDAKRRLRAGHLPVLLSDSFEGYAPAMLDAFGRRSPAPHSGLQGLPRPPRPNEPRGSPRQLLLAAEQQNIAKKATLVASDGILRSMPGG